MRLNYDSIKKGRIEEIEKALDVLVGVTMGNPKISRMEAELAACIDNYAKNPEAREALGVYVPDINTLIEVRQKCRKVLKEKFADRLIEE